MVYIPEGVVIAGLNRYKNNITESLVKSIVDWYVGKEYYIAAEDANSSEEEISIIIPIYCSLTREGVNLIASFNIYSIGDIRNTNVIDIDEGDISLIQIGDSLTNDDIFFAPIYVTAIDVQNNTITLDKQLSDAVGTVGTYTNTSLLFLPISPTKEMAVIAIKLTIKREGSQVTVIPKLAYFEGVGNKLDEENPFDLNFSNATKVGNKLKFDYDSWLTAARYYRTNCVETEAGTNVSGQIFFQDVNLGDMFILGGESPIE